MGMFLQFKLLFHGQFYFSVIATVNFANILGINNFKKEDWSRQSNNYVASFNIKRIQIFYSTSR